MVCCGIVKVCLGHWNLSWCYVLSAFLCVGTIFWATIISVFSEVEFSMSELVIWTISHCRKEALFSG